MNTAITFRPGDLVRVRHREWVVLSRPSDDLLKVRPLGGAEDDATLIYLPLEFERPVSAIFGLPDPDRSSTQQEILLLRDALRLKLRAGAGPFRSFGNLNVEPRTYQLVPLLMALRLDTVRLLVADDVGIGKTIEAGMIAREMLDRGKIDRLAVICPPHLCEQWQRELAEKFAIDAEVVRTGTATRLERGLRLDESVFEVYAHTIVSLDYIKSDRRRTDFLRTCPEFVIVDEAHTCVRSNTNTRHQRYQLLRGLAHGDARRHMVLLTATPHSGDDTAFHNLLGLLDPKFIALAEAPEGVLRRRLREELARHFVQRRRGDIAEWKDSAGFPIRESREVTYLLTGDWGGLFDKILDYARTMVDRTTDGTQLQQRMSWWAALALLRCASSSPAAASLALRTRLQAAEGETEKAQVEHLDRTASETVMDGIADDVLTVMETVPAGTIGTEDVVALNLLVEQAERLQGPRNDPKIKVLINEVRTLIKDGFRPVIFCRYVATAHYVGQEMRQALSARRIHVTVITGELTPDQRQEQVEMLAELDGKVVPVLIATDCLSEGVNLQSFFNAVIHYDLTWNPTRHEQREGRADRFGQTSKRVRALMLYGENNPVDGAVLRVILRKAEKIRKELGVTVPLPADNNKVIDAIMKAVLLHRGRHSRANQLMFDFHKTETEVDNEWRIASDRARMSRTVFAQRRLSPDDVLPEWRKAVSVLGDIRDVERFICQSAECFGAPIDQQDGYCRLPIAHFPKPLRDRLDAIGLSTSAKITFCQPAPAGADYIHRAHPLVSVFADYIAEKALDATDPKIGGRTGAVFTNGVSKRTVLYLLRLRFQIEVEQRRTNDGFLPLRSLLAEECLGIAIHSGARPKILAGNDALSLLELKPGRNMEPGQKTRLIRQALDVLPGLEDTFADVGRQRARELLADHRRIREASDIRGLRYNVVPTLPPDTIGAYVFLPMVSI
ncbi:MAG: helicase-related protein [Aestuariivita sp.]|nr:helicase-related protein [Aestuariivita sp.]